MANNEVVIYLIRNLFVKIQFIIKIINILMAQKYKQTKKLKANEINLKQQEHEGHILN